MKRTLCCLALSGLVALSGSRVACGAPLSIYTHFQHDPPMGVLSSLERELALLVSPIGLGLDWRSLPTLSVGEVSAELVLVTFKGGCDVELLQPVHIDPGALAWTNVSSGVILPFVDVNCDGLRSFLQLELLKMDGGRREQLFGRAIARLVGHEFYHVFAGTTHHGKGGVAQPTCTVEELLSDGFDFTEKEFRELRGGRLKAILEFRKLARNQTAAHDGHSGYASNGCASCHGESGQGTHGAPSLRAAAKALGPKVLASRFEKNREDMFRRARNLKLTWQFPADEEIRDITAALSIGFE